MATRPPRDRSRSPSDRPRAARGSQPPRARASERRRSDLLARVLVGIPAALIAIVFVGLGGLPFALLMLALGGVCMSELYTMLARWKPVPVAAFAALAGMIIAAQYGTQRQVVLAAVCAVPAVFLGVLARGQRSGATVSIAGTLFGVYWIAVAFAHAVLLRRLPHGSGIVIDVLLGTFLGDTAAYLGGRAFGRRPLAPSISPHKTVEGLFCGALVSILAVFSAALNQPWMTQVQALELALAVAVLGPVGDLFESLVKRDAGAKDAGRLFGAHGGALDRLDAVIFTIVAGYYLALSFGL